MNTLKAKILILGAVALLVGGSAPLTTMRANADWNYITLSTYYSFPGQNFSVSGAGFSPNEAITVSAAGASVKAAANNDGSFNSPSLTIPNSAIGSTVTVTAQGSMGHTSTAQLVVGTYYPHVTPNSYYINRGSSVSFSGVNFGPNETVVIQNDGQNLDSVKTDGSGNFSAGPFTVNYNAGNQTYTFVGQTSHTTDNVTIKVSDTQPVITLNNYYGPAGSPLQISGQFFGSNENVSVSFGGINLGSATTTKEGGFSLSTRVPQSASPGNYPVTATAGGNSWTAEQTFTESGSTGMKNASPQISIVSIDRIKGNLNAGNTVTKITPRIISTNGDSTNVTIDVQLLNPSQQVVAQQSYPNQTLVNNTPVDFPLTTPDNLQGGDYTISLLVNNADNSTNVLFPNLGTITVQ